MWIVLTFAAAMVGCGFDAEKEDTTAAASSTASGDGAAAVGGEIGGAGQPAHGGGSTGGDESANGGPADANNGDNGAGIGTGAGDATGGDTGDHADDDSGGGSDDDAAGDDDTTGTPDDPPPPGDQIAALLGCHDYDGNTVGCFGPGGAPAWPCIEGDKDVPCECDRIMERLALTPGIWHGTAELRALSPDVDRVFGDTPLTFDFMFRVDAGGAAISSGRATLVSPVCEAAWPGNRSTGRAAASTAIGANGDFVLTMEGMTLHRSPYDDLPSDGTATVRLDGTIVGPQCAVGAAMVLVEGAGLLQCPLAAEFFGLFAAEMETPSYWGDFEWPACLASWETDGGACPALSDFSSTRSSPGVVSLACDSECNF